MTDTVAQLTGDFPGWKVWRAQHNGTPASWMATRVDHDAGIDATVTAATADGLRAELTEQRKRSTARSA